MALFERLGTVLVLIAIARRGFAPTDLTKTEELICKGSLSDVFKIGNEDGMSNFMHSFSNLSVKDIERVYSYAPVRNENSAVLVNHLSLDLALAYFGSLFGDFVKMWNNDLKIGESSQNDPGSSSGPNVMAISPSYWCAHVAAEQVLQELYSDDSADKNWNFTVRSDLEIDAVLNGDQVINILIEYCKMHLDALQLLELEKNSAFAIEVLQTAYENWSLSTLTYEGITGFKPKNLNETSTVKMLFYIKNFTVRYLMHLQEFAEKELLRNAEKVPIKFTSVVKFCKNQGRRIVNKSRLLQKIK